MKRIMRVVIGASVAALLMFGVLFGSGAIGIGEPSHATAKDCSIRVLVWNRAIDPKLPAWKKVAWARSETIHYSGLSCYF